MKSTSTNVMASNTDPLSSENGTSGKGILMMQKKSPEVRGGDALPDNDEKKDSNKLISQPVSERDLPRLELEHCHGPSYRLVSESAPRTKQSRAVLNDKLVSKASGPIIATDQDRWKKNQEKMLPIEAQRSELDIRIERLAAAFETVAESVNPVSELSGTTLYGKGILDDALLGIPEVRGGDALPESFSPSGSIWKEDSAFAADVAMDDARADLDVIIEWISSTITHVVQLKNLIKNRRSYFNQNMITS